MQLFISYTLQEHIKNNIRKLKRKQKNWTVHFASVSLRICTVQFGSTHNIPVPFLTNVNQIVLLSKKNLNKEKKRTTGKKVLTVASAGWGCLNFANRRQRQSLCYVDVKRNSEI